MINWPESWICFFSSEWSVEFIPCSCLCLWHLVSHHNVQGRWPCAGHPSIFMLHYIILKIHLLIFLAIPRHLSPISIVREMWTWEGPWHPGYLSHVHIPQKGLPMPPDSGLTSGYTPVLLSFLPPSQTIPALTLEPPITAVWPLLLAMVVPIRTALLPCYVNSCWVKKYLCVCMCMHAHVCACLLVYICALMCMRMYICMGV